MEKAKVQNGGRILTSMDEIEAYTGRNRRTIIKWVQADNFPAAKIDGRWESHTDLIDTYRKRRIENCVAGGAPREGCANG